MVKKNNFAVVVGANGRLGYQITKSLINKEKEVIGIDIKKNNLNYLENLQFYNSKNKNFLKDIIKKNKKVNIDNFFLCQRYKEKKIQDNKFNIGSFQRFNDEIIFSYDLILFFFKKKMLSKNCKIFFFSSTNSKNISQQSAWYHMSKSSTEILSKWLASRLMKYKILVNCVRLDLVDGNGITNKKTKLIYKNLYNQLPISSESISQFVVELANSDNFCVTGEIINITNGYQLNDSYHMIG